MISLRLPKFIALPDQAKPEGKSKVEPGSVGSSSASARVTGLTMPDGLALVAGSAVASAQLRGVLPEHLDVWKWLLAVFVFLGITATATGPFLLLFEIWAGRVRWPVRLGLGRWLWFALGIPWTIWSFARAALPSTALRPGAWAEQVFWWLLCLTMIGAAGSAWRHLTRDRESGESESPCSTTVSNPMVDGWADGVGLALASLAPLQFVLAMLTGG